MRKAFALFLALGLVVAFGADMSLHVIAGQPEILHHAGDGGAKLPHNPLHGDSSSPSSTPAGNFDRHPGHDSHCHFHGLCPDKHDIGAPFVPTSDRQLDTAGLYRSLALAPPITPPKV